MGNLHNNEVIITIINCTSVLFAWLSSTSLINTDPDFFQYWNLYSMTRTNFIALSQLGFLPPNPMTVAGLPFLSCKRTNVNLPARFFLDWQPTLHFLIINGSMLYGGIFSFFLSTGVIKRLKCPWWCARYSTYIISF